MTTPSQAPSGATVPYPIEGDITQILNEARCLSGAVVGNRELAQRIVKYLCMHDLLAAPAPAPSEAKDEPEAYCLFCSKLGHRTDECHATHGLNTPEAREISRLASPAPAPAGEAKTRPDERIIDQTESLAALLVPPWPSP